MAVLNFEVYYEHHATAEYPFAMEDDDVAHNLSFFCDTLEYALPDCKISTTQENYSNKQISIRIQGEEPKEKIVSELKALLKSSRLSGRLISS